MKRLTKIALHPVIDFTPFYFDINKPFPVGITAKQRYDHWIKLMRTIHFGDLEPIEKGLELVRTDQLSTQSFINLLKFQGPLISCGNEEEEEEEEEEVYSAIEGGVVMTGDDQVIFMPQCCTGFYDYREWLEVKKPDHFHRIYIGHPWIYTHLKGEDLIFSGLIDNNFGSRAWEYRALDDLPRGWDWGGSLKELDPAGIKELMCLYVVNYELFRKAQQALKKEVDLFYNRVEKELQRMGIENASVRANRYVKGIGGPESYNRDAPLPVLPFTIKDL